MIQVHVWLLPVVRTMAHVSLAPSWIHSTFWTKLLPVKGLKVHIQTKIVLGCGIWPQFQSPFDSRRKARASTADVLLLPRSSRSKDFQVHAPGRKLKGHGSKMRALVGPKISDYIDP